MYSPLVSEQQSSILVEGVVRIGVRSWGRAGDELMIELVREAPNIIGLHVHLHDGPRVIAAVVKEEHEQDGRSVLTCDLAGTGEAGGEAGAV